MPGVLSVGSIQSVTSFANTTSVPVNDVVTKEYIHLSADTHQNNFILTGISDKNNVVTIVNINPSNSFVLSGIAANNISVGKNIVLRNNTGLGLYLANDSYLILLNKLDPDSAAANRIDWTNWAYPAFLLPGEEMHLIYDGVNWKLVSGTRWGSATSMWDYREYLDDYALGGTGTGNARFSGMMEMSANLSISCRITEVQTNEGYYYHGGGYGRFFVPGTSPALYTCTFMLARLGQPGDDYRVTMGFTSTVDPSYNFNHANNNVVRIGLIYDQTDYPTEGFRYITGNSSSSTANDRFELAMTDMVAQANVPYRFVAFVNGGGNRVDFFSANTNSNLTIWNKNRVTMSNTTTIYTGAIAGVPGLTIAKKTGANSANKARVYFNQYAMGGGGSLT